MSKLNVLVTGANGQLGSELKMLSEHAGQMRFTFVDIDELNIANAQQVSSYVNKLKPNFIVNAAAYTAVDNAELEPDMAFSINADAVKSLAYAAKSVNAKLIHISTDYVFNGQSYLPYNEDDVTNPNSVYGESKLKGEEYAISSGVAMVIRTSWLYSAFGNNFMKTILAKSADGKLKVVFDQVGSPTWANDLAKALIAIIEQSKNSFLNQVFHYSNEGVCSWYDFANEILRIKGIRCDINPVLSSEFKSKANRPHYSVLNKQKVKSAFGISIPYWRDSLKECLNSL